jgi:hypothetical protein
MVIVNTYFFVQNVHDLLQNFKEKLRKDTRSQVNTNNSDIILCPSKFSLSWWIFTSYHDDLIVMMTCKIILIIKITGLW